MERALRGCILFFFVLTPRSRISEAIAFPAGTDASFRFSARALGPGVPKNTPTRNWLAQRVGFPGVPYHRGFAALTLTLCRVSAWKFVCSSLARASALQSSALPARCPRTSAPAAGSTAFLDRLDYKRTLASALSLNRTLAIRFLSLGSRPNPNNCRETPASRTRSSLVKHIFRKTLGLDSRAFLDRLD